REMPAAYVHAGGVGRDQRQTDTQLLLAAEQTLGVIHLEGETEQRGDRPQGDVTLLPGHPQPEYLLTLPLTTADDAAVGHGAGVRSSLRRGEGKAGYFLTGGQTGQIVLFLFIGAVLHEQLGRSQRIGYHDRGADIAAATGQLHRDLRVGVGG